uniref:Uncharacterized protein n=1 Tax=Poecilia latipinna TaxID=48699 RepID=A0A3B3UVU9_9TELE
GQWNVKPSKSRVESTTDDVLFSNFSSPEYIRALEGNKNRTVTPPDVDGTITAQQTVSKLVCFWHRCLDRSAECRLVGFCPWRPESPCRGISSTGSRRKRNIHQELRWWQPAENPSSLRTHTHKNVSHEAVSGANLFRIYNKVTQDTMVCCLTVVHHLKTI